MPEDFRDLRPEISTFFMALRSAVDRPYFVNGRQEPEGRERFMRAMMLVEEARIRYNSYVRFRKDPTAKEMEEARETLLQFFDKFLQSPDVDLKALDKPFRLPFSPSQRDRGGSFVHSLVDNEMSIGEAIFAFRSYIANSLTSFPTQVKLEFEALKSIVPSQQVAPARFSVSQGRIVVADRSPRAADQDKENISAALGHIKESGERLASLLKQSNCDKRLLESLEDLQKQIASDENIVKVGLSNIACGIMCDRFRDEMPDAIGAMFSSYTSSVSMYVAQFPEWEQFSSKAASVDLDSEYIEEIEHTATQLIQSLEQQPEICDPSVPKTILVIREFVRNPGRASRKAAYALLKTIENLVSSIIHFSVSVVKKTAEKTADKFAATASGVIVGLLTVALVGATGIGSAAGAAGASWVKQAADVVQKQIEKLSSE